MGKIQEMLDFVNSSPPDIAKIALEYLSIEDQRTIFDAFMELRNQRQLTSEEKSAMNVVASEVLADARKTLAEFQAEHGLDPAHGVHIEPPLPPLIINDALKLGEEIKAEMEAKQDDDTPTDLGDTGHQNGDGPNGGDNNAGDLNGPDDDHKEGEIIEGEHAH
ncbi:hypothetical protein UP09_19660 [Bradyrhizobium sp. LTSP885]|uniref:hypothetical protein n=1 Tax=Bradyrhizobium sp. LTSP885 TaxID=1619232 RepID=UPI0005CA487A|nr:hypothetical protein [Bradyrhizobium sp. LTSP885]KJC42431.1 hypothetical protein UP09_19660 [Bradyrhizobium sp. LTSP885]